MPVTTATVIASAVALAAAASATQVGLGAASGGGGGGKPRVFVPPEDPTQKALRHYTSRLLAQGASSVPPSFLDFVASGGKATFNLGDVGMTPGEAIGLREVGPKGQRIPFVEHGQRALTPDQILFASSYTPQLKTQAERIRRIRRLEEEPQTPKRVAKEERIRKRIGKIEGSV